MYACVCVFFFKQKTAYEMRISDWSSDVCSSDLYCNQARLGAGQCCSHGFFGCGQAHAKVRGKCMDTVHDLAGRRLGREAVRISVGIADDEDRRARRRRVGVGEATEYRHIQYRIDGGVARRSEEHTSELQSLMRISYAVFCLKKKKQT